MFRKVLEIDIAIFQDLQSFVKGTFLEERWKCFRFFFGKILKYRKLDIA